MSESTQNALSTVIARMAAIANDASTPIASAIDAAKTVGTLAATEADIIFSDDYEPLAVALDVDEEVRAFVTAITDPAIDEETQQDCIKEFKEMVYAILSGRYPVMPTEANAVQLGLADPQVRAAYADEQMQKLRDTAESTSILASGAMASIHVGAGVRTPPDSTEAV